MESNIIICGDTLKELKKLPNDSVDLIFADPPYWMRVGGVLKRVEGTEFDGCNDHWDNQFTTLKDYNDFTENWLLECRRVLKKNGSIWVIGSMQCIYSIGSIMQNLGFWLINDVIWHKKNPTPNFMGTRLNNSHETLIWATKTEKSKFTFNYKTAKELNVDNVEEKKFLSGERKQMGSVWKISVCQGEERLKNKDGKKLHSTQKPEEILRRVIAISSKLEDIVLDPFGGTMTTGVVAKKMGRKYIMIEREKDYCFFGQERINKAHVHVGAIERAEFDIKPLKVTVPDMIAAKFFILGEKFYTNDMSEGGELMIDGKLLYNGTILDMHTCAAIVKKRKADRLNGFDIWYVMRDKKLVSIKQIREKYREFKINNI